MERQADPAREAAIQDVKGIVLDERHPSTHPLAKVVLKRAGIKTPEEIAETADPTTGNLVIDPVVFRSVIRMDGGE